MKKLYIFMAVIILITPGYAQQEAEQLLKAIVKVKSTIPNEARTAGILGTAREGNGVLLDAAYRILSWIRHYEIKILNVAVPRASKDPAIYNDVFKILDTAYKIHAVNEIKNVEKLPHTVEEAVDKFIADLPLSIRTKFKENRILILFEGEKKRRYFEVG